MHRKHHFCHVFFQRKREKLGENVSVKGENVNILGEKRQFFELTTNERKKVVKFLGGKLEIFSENRNFFGWNQENFCDRIHDPQTLNQIDAAVRLYHLDFNVH